MTDQTREIQLHERVAALEKQFEITIPELKKGQKVILDTLNDGLKAQMTELRNSLENHLSKTEHNSEIKEDRKKVLWLYFVRGSSTIMTVAALFFLYLLLDLIFSGRFAKFLELIDKVSP